MPLGDVEIVDDWHVLGLRGTGSKSLVLHDVFVPEHRCVMVSDFSPARPPGAQVHPDYPVVWAPRGFLVSYSLPPVAIALGGKALEVADPGAVRPGVARRDPAGPIRGRADGGRRGRRRDRHRDPPAALGPRLQQRRGRLGPHDPAGEALRARRDMVYAQHQVKWAVDRLCELCGARWTYDSDPLQEIRRDIEIILTHHAASRQAAMVPWGQRLLQPHDE